jgi:hypothetical protein
MPGEKQTGRIGTALIVVLTGIVFYILGAQGSKVGLAQAGGQKAPGTYQVYFSEAGKDQKTGETLRRASLLDTTTGELFTQKLDNEKGILWESIISPRFNRWKD